MKNNYKFSLIAITIFIVFAIIYFSVRLNLSLLIAFVLFLNYLLLVGVLYFCKKGMELTNENNQKKGSSIIFIINLISFWTAFIVSKVIVFSKTFFTYFFINNWMINFGGKYTKPIELLDFKLLLLLTIPLTTFLISKFIWNKNYD